MNLLILSNNPSRASFRQRIGLYLPYLSSAGISWKVENLPAGYLQRSRLFQKAREYDGVLLHKKTLNVLDAFLLGHYARAVLYDFDDAVMYSPSEAEKHFNSHIHPFRRTVRLAKMVFAGNEYLADHARPFCRDVRVVPTGLDVKAFDGLQKTKSEPLVRLVWIGSRSTLSYLERISPVLERIGRRYSNTILRIIADAFIDLDSIRVEKCFWTEELQNQQISDFLKHYHLDSRLVTYHDLTVRPDAVLSNLMEWLGYEYEPRQKEYWTFSHHGSVKKNYLKMPEGGIFFDQRWKEDLEPSVQRKVFSHPAVCAYLSQIGLRYDYERGLTAFKDESFGGCQK